MVTDFVRYYSKMTISHGCGMSFCHLVVLYLSCCQRLVLHLNNLFTFASTFKSNDSLSSTDNMQQNQNYQQEKSESDVNTCPKLPPSHPGPQHFLKQNPHFNFHFLEWFLLPAIIRGMSPHWVKAPPRTSSCSHPQPVL